MDEHLRGRHIYAGEKRGACVGKTKRGKGTKLLVVASSEGLPVGVHLASATQHETTMIEAALDHAVLPSGGTHPLVADRAYDSDQLRDRLAVRGLDLVCPHRQNRTRPKRQDGRKLRRYRSRWIIERTIAWLQNFRRVVVRWDRRVSIYKAFVHVACIVILLKRF